MPGTGSLKKGAVNGVVGEDDEENGFGFFNQMHDDDDDDCCCAAAPLVVAVLCISYHCGSLSYDVV